MKIDYLSEYKDLHYKEIELQDRLNGKVPNSIAFLSLVGTGIVFLIQELFPIACNDVSFISILLLTLTALSFIIAVCYFCKSYIGYKYYYFPIQDMYRVINANHKYARESKEDSTIKMVDENIRMGLESIFIESAINNRQQNVRKTKFQRNSTYWLLASVFLLAITFLFWTIFR